MLMRTQAQTERRRGVILLVVLAMLTLLAIMGISFVLYANAQAEAGRIGVQVENLNTTGTTGLPTLDTQTIPLFLGQLIYDVPDDSSGVYSGLRGNSLARSMYGYLVGTMNDKPFTGSGWLRGNSPI